MDFVVSVNDSNRIIDLYLMRLQQPLISYLVENLITQKKIHSLRYRIHKNGKTTNLNERRKLSNFTAVKLNERNKV